MKLKSYKVMNLCWDVMGDPFNPGTREAETDRSEFEGQPGLQRQFQDSQNYRENENFKFLKNKARGLLK